MKDFNALGLVAYLVLVNEKEIDGDSFIYGELGAGMVGFGGDL